MDSRTSTLRIPASLPSVALLGAGDSFLKVIEHAFPTIEFLVRGNQMMLTGDSPELAMAERLISELVMIIRSGQPLSDEAVARSIKMLRDEPHEKPAEVLSLNILSNRGKTIRPKTLNQKHYVDAIDKNTIVFGIGPAGTGKTYLAVAKAVQALQAKQH